MTLPDPPRVGDPEVAPARILLAEDEASLGMLLQVFLRRAGFETVLVARGDEVVREVQGRPPALCLVDLNLEDSRACDDGLDVIRRLRAVGYGGPIIAMSAADAASMEAATEAAGGDAYIAKPVRPDTLVQRVVETLQRRENR